MELILVRHAEPLEVQNPDGRPADPALSEGGRRQAESVAAWLTRRRVDRVISSPARRAVETAEATARLAGAPVAVDPRLRDANDDAPTYVPLEADRERDREDYLARVAAYRESPRLVSIADRVNEAIGEWVSQASGQRVVVFCHGSVINVYAAGVLGLDNAAFLEAGYASGHRFLISSSGVRSVQSLNETAYLLT